MAQENFLLLRSLGLYYNDALITTFLYFTICCLVQKLIISEPEDPCLNGMGSRHHKAVEDNQEDGWDTQAPNYLTDPSVCGNAVC